MKRIVGLAMVATVVVMAAGGVLAQTASPPGSPPPGPGMGPMDRPMMGGPRHSHHSMGHHMGGPMGQMGMMPCPMAGAPAAGNAPAAAGPVTEERAKQLAQEYADAHLKGFAVERALPFAGRRGTAYSVELKGPGDEIRVFHVNPWGRVMPFGGPGRRAG